MKVDNTLNFINNAIENKKKNIYNENLETSIASVLPRSTDGLL